MKTEISGVVDTYTVGTWTALVDANETVTDVSVSNKAAGSAIVEFRYAGKEIWGVLVLAAGEAATPEFKFLKCVTTTAKLEFKCDIAGVVLTHAGMVEV